jgi:uncharacterized protein involved in exopolysaccharide biosynthesis
VLKRRKWLIILPLIVATGAAIGASYLLTPVYQSSVTVWAGSPVLLSRDVERLVGEQHQVMGADMDRNRELQSLRVEITSAPYIARLAERLGLLQNSSLERRAIKIKDSHPELTLSIEEIKFDILHQEIRDRIGISFVGKNQVKIAVTSSDAAKARELAEAMGEIFIEEKIRQQMRSVHLSSGFSSQQLEKYERDLQDKIDKRTALEKEYMKIQIDDPIASEANRKAILAEVQSTDRTIEQLEEDERQASRQLAGALDGTPNLTPSTRLIELRSEASNQISAMASLVRRSALDNSAVVNQKMKLYDVEERINEEVRSLVRKQFLNTADSVQAWLGDLFAAREKLEIQYDIKNELTYALEDINAKVNAMPEYEARLEQLAREISSARELRDRFQLQQEGFEITEDLLAQTNFQLVEPAKMPYSPVWPVRRELALMGALAGLILGIAAAVAAELFDRSIRDPDEIEQQLELPVIGTIPKIDGLTKLKAGN